MTRPAITVSETSVLWFRTRRQHLAGDGAADPAAAAAAVVGIQAQREASALLGLSQRTSGRPVADELVEAIRGASPTLVRSWGPRDTLHLFDVRDWNDVCASLPQRAGGGRRDGMPGPADVEACARALGVVEGVFTKDVLHDALPADYLARLRPKAEQAGMDPVRLAATRILWGFACRGDVVLAGKRGAERLYARRDGWFADLPWDPAADPVDAAVRLCRRYLAAYAPATPADVAHFFGARVTEARGWLDRLAPELVEVRCGERRGLVALAADADDLTAASPAARDWPVRLLPMWDGLLMGHKDKTWTVPDESERSAVWRKGAHVSAVVLARGRVAATWSHKVKRGALQVEVTPLSRWRKGMAAGVRREAKAVAAHLGVDHGEMVISGPTL